MFKKRFFVKFVCIFLVSLWVILYPLQFYFAKQEMYKYMEKQGIKKENIASENFRTGLLNTDYYITIKLKDDPKFEYEYFYKPIGGLFSPEDCYLNLSVYGVKTYSPYRVGDKNIPKYLPLKKI